MSQLKHKRERYQHGSLTLEKRAKGPDAWIFRWREKASNGETVQRKKIIGTRKDYPTESAAGKAVDALQLDINSETVSTSSLTIREVAKHYKEKELGEESKKTAKTREVYTQHLDDYIVPRWGNDPIARVRGVRVKEWLQSLDLADGTKAKTKSVFSFLYQHAISYGWAESNPLRSFRQSAKPEREFDILTDEETVALLTELPGHAKAMAVVAAVTGLRRGELVGLKWEDVDFNNKCIHVRRSVVEQVEGQPKTKGSKKPVPMESALAYCLSRWKEQTKFTQPRDWVFASPYHVGKTPYWPNTVLDKVIRPAALEVGINKHIGWHTFRRTVATLLVSQGESIKTTQETLRHASPTVTLGIYAQAISQDKREAQSKIATLLRLENGGEHIAVPA